MTPTQCTSCTHGSSLTTWKTTFYSDTSRICATSAAFSFCRALGMPVTGARTSSALLGATISTANWFTSDLEYLSMMDLRLINWLPEDVHVLSTILPSIRDLRFINWRTEDVQGLSSILPSRLPSTNQSSGRTTRTRPLRGSTIHIATCETSLSPTTTVTWKC